MRYKTQWLGKQFSSQCTKQNPYAALSTVGYLCMFKIYFLNIISDVCFSSYGVKIILFVLNNARLSIKILHFLKIAFIYVVCVKKHGVDGLYHRTL